MEDGRSRIDPALRGSLTLQARSQATKSGRSPGRLVGLLLALLGLLAATSCYTASAARGSRRLVRSGFDLEHFGPWVVVTGPGALLLAGGNMLVGSVFPLGRGVDPREPEAKWFHAYEGAMRPASEVAVLCNRERATWITGIRPATGGRWQAARNQKWHFPVCIEALPGDYELEVHYFWRETEKDSEESVSRQAESTEPSTVRWRAQAGHVYLLSAEFGDPAPAQSMPPQRHIPRSRDLGTTWWGLEESDWTVRIDPVADWDDLEGPVREQRRAWMEYECRRNGC
jgi:hypothetical protein